MRSTNDAPPAPSFRGRLTFSQCSSQPTASQALSAALSGCSLNSQGGSGGGGEAQPPPPPPPPPRWGAPPPPLPPPLAADDGPDVPLSQLASQVPDSLMLGSQDFLTPADQDLDQLPPAGTALGRHARSPAAAPSPLRGAAKRARAPPRGVLAVSTPAADGVLPPSHLNPAARRRPPGSPPVARNPFVAATATSAAADAVAAATTTHQQRWPLVSRYRTEYREIATLGTGAFARVVRAVHRLDGTEYAIKRSQREVFAPADAARWQLEAAALAALPAHPGIVRYYGAWAEAGAGGGTTFYIALEACGVSVGTRAAVAGGAALAEPEVVSIGAQAAAALAHMHRSGVAHMDVKPENMLTGARDEAVIKLGDLGLAAPLGADAAARAPLAPDEGDCRYVAPEVLAGTADATRLDKADVFALGASLYELASGAPLPRGGAAYQDFRAGRVRLLPGVSTGLQRVMRAMLAPAPEDRPAAAAVVRMLGRLGGGGGGGGVAPADENVAPPPSDAAMQDVKVVVAAAPPAPARPAAPGFGRLELRPA